ncbi:amidase [Leucobacter sp. CSA1]|uniref:Amidase n=1 Tax=Leucobacter chromiisoli TaxID=2796471 RepID=A0A934UTX3_9MICO|nr:amidase [Leucobacter chromiisoli]MBK0417801.1 amidase [Leucobacter chromiisoli]
MSTASSRSELRAMTGRELSAGFTAGDFDPVDVAEAVIETVEERNPELNAFTEFTPENVRSSAERSAERWRRGEQLSDFDGVPWTIKENLRREGVDYRSGTAATDPSLSTANAPVVDRALESGAVIVGSTTMPDWGMLSSGVSSINGISRSPWDPSLTTGGSSAGAGAAAAAGFAVANIGTDIGGSIRLPGTWLGLATLKPSDGRVPLDNPYLGRAAGPMSRTVEDLAWTMEIVSRPDARDYTALPGAEIDWTQLGTDVSKLRVGLHLDAGAGLELDPEVRDAVAAAGRLFAAAGAEVVEVDPFITDDMLTDLDQFWRVRSWATYRALPAEKQMRVLPFIADWCMGGSDVPGSRVLECYETIQELRAATTAATQPYDIVLSPVATRAAFPAEWPMPFGFENGGMSHIGFTLPYNMSGQPAATVNCGLTSDGRTIGLQLSGRRFDDLGVLQAASWYEAARPAEAAPQFPVR